MTPALGPCSLINASQLVDCQPITSIIRKALDCWPDPGVQMTNRIPSIVLQNIYNIFTRNRFYHRPELFVHIECQPEMSLMKVLATTTQICHNFIYFIPGHRFCRHKKAILRNNQLCTMPWKRIVIDKNGSK